MSGVLHMVMIFAYLMVGWSGLEESMTLKLKTMAQNKLLVQTLKRATSA